MPRLCGHLDESLPAADEPYLRGACRECYLYVNHAGFRARRDGRAEVPHPGSELKSLLSSLGIEPSGCNCASLVAQMNVNGVEWCRDHADEILAQLRENAGKLGWLDKLKAGVLAAAGGLVLNPLDPAPGLLEEAIRRAEQKEV